MIRRLILSAFTVAIALTAMATLPSVKLRDLDGNVVDTATIGTDGKPVIVDFWATWCKPCVRELKAIAEVYEEWQEETGVTVYAISLDEAQNEQRVRPFVENKGWEYVVLLDPNGDFKRAMGVNDPPHVFVVDGQGNITWNHQGYVDGGEEEIIEAVRKITE